jgi:hypothetical protein
MNRPLLAIVFLDLDDVLCLNTTVGGYDAILAVNGRHSNPGVVYRDLFDPGACGVLKRVHDSFGGELRYVVSSTWRESLGREQMATVFKASGLGFVAKALEPGERWCTPAKLGRRRRADEIAAWLDQHHCGEPFVIVDDTYSGASLEPALTLQDHPFHRRLVLCRETEGLLDHHAQTMVDALSRPINSPY